MREEGWGNDSSASLFLAEDGVVGDPPRVVDILDIPW
jgi:hypothetical protein